MDMDWVDQENSMKGLVLKMRSLKKNIKVGKRYKEVYGTRIKRTIFLYHRVEGNDISLL